MTVVLVACSTSLSFSQPEDQQRQLYSSGRPEGLQLALFINVMFFVCCVHALILLPCHLLKVCDFATLPCVRGSVTLCVFLIP